MKKFIPREKLSKKAQCELNDHIRKTWGTLNPVTRAPANPKVYNRKKLRKDDYDSSPKLFHFVFFIFSATFIYTSLLDILHFFSSIKLDRRKQALQVFFIIIAHLRYILFFVGVFFATEILLFSFDDWKHTD